MLSVGIDAAAVGIAVLERPRVAGGDPRLQTAVLAERQHLGAVGARDLGGAVGGAVVDDEHVGLGQLARQALQHRGEVLLLVPGGDEDDGVAHPRSSCSTIRSCARRMLNAASSHAIARRLAGTGAVTTVASIPRAR
jgi:hypothetical protein